MRSFYKNIRHVALQGGQIGKAGKLGSIGGKCPFCFVDGPTNADTGDKTV